MAGMKYTDHAGSFLQRQYIIEQKDKQSNNNWNSYDVEDDSDKTESKCLKRFRRLIGGPLSCANCRVCLIGLVIGSLIAGISLAIVIAWWAKSSSSTTTTSTTSTTSTSTSTTSTSSTSTTTTTSTTTSTSTTTTSTSTTSKTTTTTSTTTTSTSTSTTSSSSSTSTTSTSTSTCTTTTTTDAPTTLPYTASTSTCSSTTATSCVTPATVTVSCQSYEVSWNGHCYYLDGSGGNCATGYTLAPNSVLTCISASFAGKDYQSTVSSNCCIWTADTYECFGLGSNCNTAGPFTNGPTVGGSGCTNAQNHGSQQLTFCGSI